MRPGGFRRASARGGRAVVGSRSRNRSGGAAAGVVLDGRNERRNETGLEPPAVALDRILDRRRAAVGDGNNRGLIFDTYRTSKIFGAAGFVLSVRASLSNPVALAALRLVPAHSGLCRVPVRDPAALYVQRKIILAAGTSVRRGSIWAIRESQPFCRAGGTAHPAGTGHPDPGG